MKTPVSQSPLTTPVYDTSAITAKTFTLPELYFEDVTLQAGILRGHLQRSEKINGLHESLGAGACAFDVDNDGWVDLLQLNGSGTTHFYGKPQWWQTHNNSLTLYRNNGDETFTDITIESGLTSQGWTMGCAYGDIDNDGDQDIFISNYGENQLWENIGNNQFQEITQNASIFGNHWSTSINFVDVNKDGLIDIYVNNFLDFRINSLTFEKHSGYENTLPPSFNPSLYDGQENQLFINQGNNRFIEKAKEFGIDNPQGRSLHSFWFDLNQDGFPDLMVANGKNTPNKIFLNNAGKKFKDISVKSRIGFIDKSSHFNMADFNLDGKTDIFIGTDHSEFAKLYSLDNKASSFHDNSDEKNISSLVYSGYSHWGSAIEDFNLDGLSDIVIANGLSTPDSDPPLLVQGQTNNLLVSGKNNGFINVEKSLAPNTISSFSSRCALSTDYNNDGQADIFITNNNDYSQLLKNTSAAPNWMGITLSSKETSVSGAQVTLEITSKEKIHKLKKIYGTNHSFLCMGDERLRFGLAGLIDKTSNDTININITINWPNGNQQILKNLVANQYHLIRYQEKGTDVIPSTKKQVSTLRYKQPLNKLTVIEWLIQTKKIKQARQELRLISDINDSVIQSKLLDIIQQLPQHEAAPFIQKGLTSPFDKVRLKAIKLAIDSENEQLNRWLLKNLYHESSPIACAVANGYGFFFDEEEAYFVYKNTAIIHLIELAYSDSIEKQLCAIHALGKSEHYRALETLLQLSERTNGYSEAIRIAAIQSLALLKEKSALPLLQKIVNNDREPDNLRLQARKSIQQIDNGLLTSQPVTPDESPSIDEFSSIKITINCDKSNHFEKIEFLQACLKDDVFYREKPAFIEPVLQQESIAQKRLLSLLPQRKERWARDIVLNTLNDTNRNVEDKIILMDNMPLPLPSAYTGLMNDIYNQSEYLLSLSAAKLLLQSGNDSIMGELINQYLDIGNTPPNEDKLIEINQIIYLKNPEKAIELAVSL